MEGLMHREGAVSMLEPHQTHSPHQAFAPALLSCLELLLAPHTPIFVWLMFYLSTSA